MKFLLNFNYYLYLQDVAKAVTKILFNISIYSSKDEFREATEEYLKANHQEYYNRFSKTRWSTFYNNKIHQEVILLLKFYQLVYIILYHIYNIYNFFSLQLLIKQRSLRGTLASKAREALFAFFGESDLPPINNSAASIEIAAWKRKKEVALCYNKIFTPRIRYYQESL